MLLDYVREKLVMIKEIKSFALVLKIHPLHFTQYWLCRKRFSKTVFLRLLKFFHWPFLKLLFSDVLFSAKKMNELHCMSYKNCCCQQYLRSILLCVATPRILTHVKCKSNAYSYKSSSTAKTSRLNASYRPWKSRTGLGNNTMEVSCKNVVRFDATSLHCRNGIYNPNGF